jgi:hypothetical protein
LARWHVHYADDRGRIHGVIQVQSIAQDLMTLEAWCEARGGISRFELAGLLRVADAESGVRIDLQAWLRRARRSGLLARRADVEVLAC